MASVQPHVVWEWRHPQADSLAQRGRTVAIVLVVVVVAVMLLAGWSQRDAGIGAVLLSAAVGPGLLALLAAGSWYAAFGKPQSFRLYATADGQVHAGRRSARLAGASVVLVQRTTTTTSGSTTTARSTVVTLTVVDAAGERTVFALPGAGLGSRLLTDAEREQLQAELRWLASTG